MNLRTGLSDKTSSRKCPPDIFSERGAKKRSPNAFPGAPIVSMVAYVVVKIRSQSMASAS